MDSMRVVIHFVIVQLARQVRGVPKKYPIKVLPPDCSDETLDERMRNRSARNRFNFLDLQHAQVCEPAVKTKEWIVIRTEVFRFRLPSSGAIEHAAHRYMPSMDVGAMPNPMIRRVKTSMTSITQWLRRRIDSTRNKSTDQTLSLA